MKRHFKSKTTDVGRSVIVSYIFFAIKGAKKKQHNHLPNPYIERNLIHLIAWVISRNYVIFFSTKKSNYSILLKAILYKYYLHLVIVAKRQDSHYHLVYNVGSHLYLNHTLLLMLLTFSSKTFL